MSLPRAESDARDLTQQTMYTTTPERGYAEWDLSSTFLPELFGDFSLINPFLSHFTAADMRPGEKKQNNKPAHPRHKTEKKK